MCVPFSWVVILATHGTPWARAPVHDLFASRGITSGNLAHHLTTSAHDKLLTTALPALVFSLAAHAAPLPDRTFEEGGITVVPVDTATTRLAMYLKDDEGRPLRSFDRLAASLSQSGRTLRFAMNAGMYEANGDPVGLLVIDRKVVHPLNRQEGKGNFFLKPNGVFALTDDGPRIVATGAYDGIAPRVRFATQSGPMLLMAGRINPVLDRTWSKFTRNGVCVIGRNAYFVISDKPLTLYDFAAWFKDRLGCRDALYLDGSVSSLYAKALGRHDRRDGLGPLIGVAN